jgi:hypothetical protein
MTNRYCSAAMAVTLALPSVACHSGESASGDWLSPADSTVVVELSSDDMSCVDCVEMKRVATLGDTTGNGFVDFSAAVVRDSLGRYWLNQDDRIKVFDGNGKYVGEVGRPGKGPMEFSRPLPVRALTDGNVVVYDPDNGRETIISSQFAQVSAMRFRTFPNVTVVEPLPEAHHYAANLWFATSPEGARQLHVISGDSILESFGLDPTTSGPQNPMEAIRALATDDSGRIFSAKHFEYDIGAWTSHGRRIVRYKGPALNAHTVKMVPYNLEDNPYPNEIRDLQIDPAGRLWVLIWKVRPDWQNLFEPTVFPDGSPGLKLKADASRDSLLSSRIDVIDTHRGRIVARLNAPGAINGFAGAGLLFQNISLPDGTPEIVIWEVKLDTPDES